jgi:signal peptidase II
MRDESAAPSNVRVFWIAAVSVVVLDVITKQLAERLLTPHLPVRVLGGFGRLTLVYNKGAAFSMSLGEEYNRYIFGTFALLALVILWRLARQSRGDRLKTLALGLAWGGAAGNLIDRVRGDQGVVAVLLAIVLWGEDREAAKRKRARAGVERETGTADKLGERTGT